MKISFALMCLLAMVSKIDARDAGHKARQCTVNSDCGNNYCCGTLKPKDTRYNSYDLTKKYCEKKTAKHHYDIDDYDYTFTCASGGSNVPEGFVGLYDDKYNDWI